MNLLVVTEFPPNASGGGPAVVRQMLRNWPAESLFWWSCFPDKDARFGQNVAGHRHSSIPSRLYPRVRLSIAKSELLERLWAPWASRHLRKTTAEFTPDVLWVIPHNWSILPIAKAVIGSPKLHATMQDYVDVHYNPQRFGVERCRQMAALADELYARARTRDATSHPMIADLRSRTGKDAAQMLHAGLELADFDFLERNTPRASPAIRIAYAGTILVEDVFALFVSALERIRGELARPLELHLFGAHTYTGRPWFRREWMVEHGNLPELKLLSKLRQCDWGFAPMALNDDDPRYNRFSFPTKFITYLAAGLPLITLGHPESAVMKMAGQYAVGFCSSTKDKDLLAVQLKSALVMHLPWERYAQEIKRCARVEFDAERMRRTLYACFQECASNRYR